MGTETYNIAELQVIICKAKAFDWLIEQGRVDGYDVGCPEVDSSCGDKNCQECWLEYIDEQIKQKEKN